MKKILLLCGMLCSLGSYGAFGQGHTETYGISIMSGGDVYFNFPPNALEDRKQEQNPFLFSEYKTGFVFLDENDLHKASKIKFNILTNDVEAEVNRKMLYYDPNLIKGFIIMDEGQKRLFIRAKSVRSNKLEFYEVLLNDKITVLLDRDYVLKKGNYNPALNIGNKDSYTVKQNLFLIKDGNIVEVKKRKKQLLDLVAPYQQQINDMVNERQLSWSKNSDVIDMLKAYNSLLKSN